NSEDGEDVAFDSNSNLYVSGKTTSNNFPTTVNAFQRTPNSSAPNGDAFVMSLTPSGTIRWSTYLGGSGNESALAIGVSPMTGNVWIGGYTNSAPGAPPGFPLVGAFDLQNTNVGGTYGTNDAFISELDPLGQVLVFSSFLGEDGGTEIYDLTFDGSGNV